MFETRSAIHDKRGAAAAVLPGTARAGTALRKTDVRPDHLLAELAVDEVLAESFPASDPPSWNSGTAHLNSVGPRMDQGRPMEIATESRHTVVSRDGVVGTSPEVSRDMTYVDIAISFAGATGIVLLVPVAILLVGLPVVLSVRGVVEALGWLFGIMAS
jgi:hypothetical protein